MRLQYGPVTVRADDDDGLITAAISGPVDAAAAALIIGDAHRWGGSPLVQVVSYELARVDVGASDLFAAAVSARPEDVPTALVVSAGDLWMWSEYVRLHALRGNVKAVFTSAEAARGWAARQAAVFSYWSRVERSRRSAP